MLGKRDRRSSADDLYDNIQLMQQTTSTSEDSDEDDVESETDSGLSEAEEDDSVVSSEGLSEAGSEDDDEDSTSSSDSGDQDDPFNVAKIIALSSGTTMAAGTTDTSDGDSDGDDDIPVLREKGRRRNRDQQPPQPHLSVVPRQRTRVLGTGRTNKHNVAVLMNDQPPVEPEHISAEDSADADAIVASVVQRKLAELQAEEKENTRLLSRSADTSSSSVSTGTASAKKSKQNKQDKFSGSNHNKSFGYWRSIARKEYQDFSGNVHSFFNDHPRQMGVGTWSSHFVLLVTCAWQLFLAAWLWVRVRRYGVARESLFLAIYFVIHGLVPTVLTCGHGVKVYVTELMNKCDGEERKRSEQSPYICLTSVNKILSDIRRSAARNMPPPPIVTDPTLIAMQRRRNT